MEVDRAVVWHTQALQVQNICYRGRQDGLEEISFKLRQEYSRAGIRKLMKMLDGDHVAEIARLLETL